MDATAASPAPEFMLGIQSRTCRASSLLTHDPSASRPTLCSRQHRASTLHKCVEVAAVRRVGTVSSSEPPVTYNDCTLLKE